MAEADKITGQGATMTTDPSASAGTDAVSNGGSASNNYGSNMTSADALKDYGQQTGKFQQMGDKALNLVKGLYSGDETSILSSVQGMASNMGVNSSMWDYFMNNSSDYTAGPGGSSGPGGRYVAPGKNVNNNVSIVVQVPDVTAADATKFAQLVKSYLDEDSLISSTGGA
jgi:hypothetical protein